MQKKEKAGAANTAAMQILKYIEESAGLLNRASSPTELRIIQKADGKSLRFLAEDIEEVIPRLDTEGNPFLQVNFHSGMKILLTESLVGFKPAISPTLDMGKLPSVVTTPDLLSVVEAIEETLSSGGAQAEELEILRRVFGSVLEGGEAVGFDLTAERVWLTRISHLAGEHSA
ncbi:MAG: hypothetical protein KDD35_02070 [Bdellovibrionales bacterium]|nr:hypothetical protein [Bdellovibrionales bacterium]